MALLHSAGDWPGDLFLAAACRKKSNDTMVMGEPVWSSAWTGTWSSWTSLVGMGPSVELAGPF